MDSSIVALDRCTVTGDRARQDPGPNPTVSADAAARLADVFAILGDPSRVRILLTLLQAGERCVCDLAELVEMSTSALSHALRLLRATGVVVSRREGRMVYYRLTDHHVRLLLTLAQEHLDEAASAPASAPRRQAVRR